ncbi:MAG: hypothetical protein LBQ54_08970 [Planctomycetaceae bacterium]|nr:hypothetical protein [Planctomycetaceae bacterium]
MVPCSIGFVKGVSNRIEDNKPEWIDRIFTPFSVKKFQNIILSPFPICKNDRTYYYFSRVVSRCKGHHAAKNQMQYSIETMLAAV